MSIAHENGRSLIHSWGGFASSISFETQLSPFTEVKGDDHEIYQGRHAPPPRQIDFSQFRDPGVDPPFYDPKKWNDILSRNAGSLLSSEVKSSVEQLRIDNSPPKAVTRTSLDTKVQNLPKKRTLSRKQKRAFHRFISGIKRARYFGKRVRFFTLTTAESAKERYFTLTDDFQVLRKRIDRHWGRIEYCRVTTNEAFGVIHVVYAGGFIPQQWLSRNWEEIHESPIVDVRAIKGSNKKLAGYLASQYCSEQKASYTRMSWSWRWVFKGFVSVWYAIRKQYGLQRGIREWNKVLMFRAETCSQQSILKVENDVKST